MADSESAEAKPTEENPVTDTDAPTTESSPPEVETTEQPQENPEEETKEQNVEDPVANTEDTTEPLVEDALAQPPAEDVSAQPQAEDASEQPQGDASEQPQAEGVSAQLPAEGESEQPQADASEQPQKDLSAVKKENAEAEETSQQPPADDQAAQEEQGSSEQPPAERIAEQPEQEDPKESPTDSQAQPEEPSPADRKAETGKAAPQVVGGDDEAERVDVTTEIKSGDIPESSSPQLDATATVKFVLMPSGQVVTLACNLGQTFLQLKHHFSVELKMPAATILLMFDGNDMPDGTILADLGVGPNGTIQLEMQSSDPISEPIKPYKPKHDYHMPDVINVKVEAEDGSGYKDVIVEIERSMKKKPFLGGFRHKLTGVEFLNATAQTNPKVRPPIAVERYCRDTQTVQQRNRPQQTTNDMSTQMTGIGIYVSNMEDKMIIPGKYVTAEEYHNKRWTMIIIIQKYYRRWLAKRYVHKLKDEKQRRLEWEREEEIRKKKEKEDRIKKEFERRMNPNSKEDFDLLFHALEKWRLEEVDRISNTLTGAEKKAALCMLLDQETQLLAAIDRHKLEADKSNKVKRIQDFLSKAAAPKKWKAKDGRFVEMDTPYTIRAKELQDIYTSINMKYLTQDERLDVLLTLKHTVKEHDCKLTQEIIELIDREADLLMRGVKEENLDGLRKRISTLFLQYIKTPTFNPEAAKLLKIPQDPSVLRKNIYFCPSCNNYLPSTDFPLSSNSTNVGKCRRCAKIDNDARIRQDFSHYRYMIKSLRKVEETYNDGSEIAFLLQEADLRYLVENIWNGQSVLSAWEDLYDLVTVRWNKHEEWSPWNCLLVTKDEASAHDKLSTLDEGYGQVFIHKIKQKHTLARNYFSRLPGMAEIIRQRAGQRDMGSRGPSVAGTSVSRRIPQKV